MLLHYDYPKVSLGFFMYHECQYVGNGISLILIRDQFFPLDNIVITFPEENFYVPYKKCEENLYYHKYAIGKIPENFVTVKKRVTLGSSLYLISEDQILLIPGWDKII